MLRRFDGANWTDIANVKRWNGSAWVDCEFVRRWNGTAWVDVWTNTAPRYMYEHINTLKDKYSVYAKALPGIGQDYPAWTITSAYHGGTGEVSYLADANLVNPTVKVDYYGYLGYRTSTTDYNLEAGDLYAFGMLSDGRTYAERIVYLGDSNGATQGIVEKTINGSFIKFGYRIVFRYHGLDESYYPFYTVSIKKYLVNNKPFIPDMSLEFDTR